MGAALNLIRAEAERKDVLPAHIRSLLPGRGAPARLPADRPRIRRARLSSRAVCQRFFFSSIAACAAARRATGTRNGEQLT
jgi:hypothetical protein